MNTLVINKEDLRHNINKIKEYAKKSGQDDAGKDVKIIAVVKGNGYGMGIVEYTKFLMIMEFLCLLFQQWKKH